MTRVKIKFKNPQEGRLKRVLLQTLSESNIYATRIITTSDGYVVLTKTDEDLHKILAQEVISEFKQHDFNPITPPEFKAKGSVILQRLDDYIYNNTVEDITTELADQNEWIGEEDIEEVYKSPRSNTLKITFQQINTAKKALTNGVLMFAMSVPPNQIKQEIYIITCMKCYQIEDHYTSQGNKPRDHKICSECGETGHV